MPIVEVKGSAIKDTLDALTQRVGADGLARILGMMKPESSRALEKPLASLWYPLDAFTELLEIDIRETAGGNEKELITRSEAVIDRQLRGIYRVFIRVGSPEFVIKRIASVHETYFRGVHAEARIVPPNEAFVRYAGFSKQHRIIEYAILGFYKKALEISGARNVLAAVTKSVAEEAGYAEVRLRWSNPRADT